jgi:hypothetical protein
VRPIRSSAPSHSLQARTEPPSELREREKHGRYLVGVGETVESRFMVRRPLPMISRFGTPPPLALDRWFFYDRMIIRRGGRR